MSFPLSFLPPLPPPPSSLPPPLSALPFSLLPLPPAPPFSPSSPSFSPSSPLFLRLLPSFPLLLHSFPFLPPPLSLFLPLFPPSPSLSFHPCILSLSLLPPSLPISPTPSHAVAEVQWDSGGLANQSCAGGSGTSGWDGAKSTSTVEQLTRHPLDKLGNQGVEVGVACGQTGSW